MTRIVILGDSLSLPRPDSGVEHEDTYPYLLTSKGYEVICRSRRANDTKNQTLKTNLLNDLIYYKPNFTIIHLGIVDCAPRIFSRNIRRNLSRLPGFLRKRIINFLSKHRYKITKLFKIKYVSLSEFEVNLRRLVKVNLELNAKVVLVKILMTNSTNLINSYNFENNINNYNAIIEKLGNEFHLNFIDPNKLKFALLEDGIHINKAAHQYIAQEFYKLSK